MYLFRFNQRDSESLETVTCMIPYLRSLLAIFQSPVNHLHLVVAPAFDRPASMETAAQTAQHR